MKIEGVQSYAHGDDDVVNIIFDDQRVTVQKIINTLKDADLVPVGKPVMLR
jgi:hypothetical protein